MKDLLEIVGERKTTSRRVSRTSIYLFTGYMHFVDALGRSEATSYRAALPMFQEVQEVRFCDTLEENLRNVEKI